MIKGSKSPSLHEHYFGCTCVDHKTKADLHSANDSYFGFHIFSNVMNGVEVHMEKNRIFMCAHRVSESSCDGDGLHQPC